MPHRTGAAVIAQSLHQLGVDVIFGLVGIPVVQIAEEAIALGIRFIAFATSKPQVMQRQHMAISQADLVFVLSLVDQAYSMPSPE